MAEPLCHYCNEPAEEECPVCGRLYCAEHGEAVCIRCMSPEAAVPSATVFRGSVLVLVIASLVALFVWIDPPHTNSTNAVLTTATTAAKTAAHTVTPAAHASASVTQPRATPTVPAVSPTAAASASPATSSPGHTYTIQAGDTLETIAAANNVTVAQIQELNPTLNPNLIPGTVLQLP